MARRRRVYNWPADWPERRVLRALMGETLDNYITEIGDGQIRLEEAMANCLDNGDFRLRLDPSTPQYRRDGDEKTLRRFVSDQLRLALARLGTSIIGNEATERRLAYVWVPDHPDRQLSQGFYRRLGALEEDELNRFHERNQKLRVAFEMREIAAVEERKLRVPVEDKTKVEA